MNGPILAGIIALSDCALSVPMGRYSKESATGRSRLLSCLLAPVHTGQVLWLLWDFGGKNNKLLSDP
jgi:hypothetical protein